MFTNGQKDQDVKENPLSRRFLKKQEPKLSSQISRMLLNMPLNINGILVWHVI